MLEGLSNMEYWKKNIPLAIALIFLISSVFVSSQFSSYTPSSSIATARSDISAVNTKITANQSVPLAQSVILRRGYYTYYEIDSFSNNTFVSYNVSSVYSISIALMTSAQLNDFENNNTDPISNSVTCDNTTSLLNSVNITSGQYFLVFYYPLDSFERETNIEFGYVVTPNAPFSYGALPTPLSSGIATYGISNNSGVVTPYEVQTNEIVGTANISQFQVYTPNAARYGVTLTGATLQLNTLLVVNDNNSSEAQVYWVQGVPDFETGPSVVSFGDEIWNNTNTLGFLSNQSITSTNFNNGGAVYPTGNGNTGPYVYSYSSNNFTYSLPFNFAILLNETLLPNSGVLIQFGYILDSNGSGIASPAINWFDNVTIVDPNVQSAYFDVNGNSTTPIGSYYDTELVFAGEGNAESATFTELSASLGLFYHNASSAGDVLTSFPTCYSFGEDSGEAANDLVVAYSNGIAIVSTGAFPNYDYLGNSTLSINLNSLLSAQETTNTSTTSTTTQTSTSLTNSSSSTQTSSSQTSSSTTSASSNSSTAGGGGNITLPAWELEVGGAVVVVVIASLAVMALRRKPASSLSSWQPAA